MIRICGEPTSARDGQALALTAAKVLAARLNRSVKPLRLVAHELAGLRYIERRHSSSSVADSSRQVRLLRIVPLTSDARCGTVATTWRS